jgi:hypothetical protein
MESFDEALALISETMGFQDVGYTKLNEGVKRDMWSMYSANLSATDNKRMSEYGRGWEPRADAELVEAVEGAASIDLRLYAHAVRAFNKKVRRCISRGVLLKLTATAPQVSKRGARFEALLAALQTAGDGWHGQRPFQRYEWRSAPQALPGAVRVLPRIVASTNTTPTALVWSFLPVDTELSAV